MMMKKKILALAWWIFLLLAIACAINTFAPRPAAAWPWEQKQEAPRPVPKPERCHDNCEASETGLALIRLFEGLSLFRYKDAAGYDTIGFGHLIVPGERFNEPLMPHEADSLLKKDVKRIERGVNKLVVVPLFQNQFDAIVSFTFNLGEGNLRKSTLLKRVNAERHDLVPAEFVKWVKAAGVILRGLVLRRNAEAELYAS